MRQLQGEREYDNDEDGVADAIKRAINDETLLRDGQHHVVYGDYGKLTACKKAGSLETPPHLFVKFELHRDYVNGTEDDRELLESAPIVETMLNVIENEVLPYGDIEPSLSFNSPHEAIFRLEQ